MGGAHLISDNVNFIVREWQKKKLEYLPVIVWTFWQLLSLVAMPTHLVPK